MKKRVVSVLLAVCMCFQMLPAAFADDSITSTVSEQSQEQESTTDGESLPFSGLLAEDESQALKEAEETDEAQATATPIPTEVPENTEDTEATPTPVPEEEEPVVSETPVPSSPMEVEAGAASEATKGPLFAAPKAIEEDAAVVGSGSCGENLTWTKYEDGRLIIAGTGAMNDYLEGGPWKKDIVSVEISQGVTSIGDNAFQDCKKLTSIIIPESVQSLGANSLSGCDQLTSAGPIGSQCDYEFGWSESIPSRAFEGCEGLKTIILPEQVSTFGDYAFSGCSSLEEITIPSSVVNIGKYAFYNCKQIKDIVIPYGNTNIYNGTFSGCSSLEHIILPESVMDIGDSAFDGCKSLTEISIPDIVVGIGNYAFRGCSSLQSIVLPSALQKIGNYSFYRCENLINVEIPGGVTHIGEYAFSNCTQLEKITILNGVKTIGIHAFENCSALSKIVIPESVTGIGDNAFYKCTSLTSAGPIGSGCDYEFGWQKKIPGYAFSYCSNLSKVIIPDSITEMGMVVFRGCPNLTSAGPIGSGCDYEFGWKEAIPSYAFQSCSGLTSVTLPDGITSIGSYAFSGCNSMQEIYIPDSVNSMGVEAFYGCSSLTSIKIPVGVSNIARDAFFNCTSLISIELPDGLTTIEMNAFYNCNNLRSVTIPASLEAIDLDAFWYCKSISDVYYAGSEEEWNNIWVNGGNTNLLNATIHYGSELKGFWPQRDGWCILNGAEMFGYPLKSDGVTADYSIPFWSYFALDWPSISNMFAPFASFMPWGGNCFGLSVSSVAEYNGQIDLKKNFASKEGDSLNEYGYSTIEQKDGKKYYSLAKNRDIIQFIELMQTSQFTGELANAEVFKNGKDQDSKYYTEVLNYLDGDNPAPLVIGLTATKSGHALVTDTTKKPLRQVDGTYIVYCYDSNAVQLTNKLDDPYVQYNYEQSFIKLDPQTGNWTYYYNGNAKYISTFSYGPFGYRNIRFFNISKLQPSFFDRAEKLTFAKESETIYGGNSIAISTETADNIFEVSDGEISISSPECEQQTYYEGINGESNVSKGYITYPTNAKTVVSQGNAVIMNIDDTSIIGYATNGNVLAQMNEENTNIKLHNEGDTDTYFYLVQGNKEGSASTIAKGVLEADKTFTMNLTGKVATAMTDSDPDRITTELYFKDDIIEDQQFHKQGYTIVAKVGENGAITPAGNTLIETGGNQSFTITPDTGYVIADVLVDGTSVGAVRQYTFDDVKADHTIYATFVPEQGTEEHGIKSFTVTGVPTKTTYDLGESFDISGLTLNITYEDGTTKAITEGYMVEPAVMAADTTQVILSYRGVAAKPIAGLTVRENLVSIQAPQSITGLPNGTEKTAKALGLPEGVKITTSRVQQSTTEAAVTWNVENCDYDPYSKEAQTFKVQGTVTLPEGMTNLQGVPLTVEITVSVDARTIESEKLPVTIVPTKDVDKLLQIYKGEEFDVIQLFEIDGNAGAATYTLLDGGTGTGSLTEDGNLTVTKAGTFVIQVNTAATDTHAAGSAQVTMTVNKGQGKGTLQVTGSTYPAGVQPAVQDNLSSGSVTYYYNTVDSNQGGSLWTSDTVLDAGKYWMYAEIAATDLYEAYTTSAVPFTVQQAVVDQLNLANLITAPVCGATPQTELSTSQFTGTILWSDTPTVFAPETVYTATVKLTADQNYTLEGLKADSFQYAGAEVHYDPMADQLTIVFPATDGRQVQSFAVTGTPSKTTYDLGEAFDVAGLTMTVTYDDGTTETVTSGYRVEPATMAADTTQVVLSYGGVKAEPVTGLTVRENLVSIQAPQAITGLANGTEKTAEALGLPKTVKITTSRTQRAIAEADVTWDLDACSYDPAVESEQTFVVQGFVSLPQDMTNLQNVPLTVAVQVTVKASESKPTEPENPGDTEEKPGTSNQPAGGNETPASTASANAQSAADDTTQEKQNQTVTVPQTGDPMPITVLVVLMAVSFAGILALSIKRKKDR